MNQSMQKYMNQRMNKEESVCDNWTSKKVLISTCVRSSFSNDSMQPAWQTSSQFPSLH